MMAEQAEQKTTVRMVDGREVPAPGAWEIDPIHSNVGFTARYMMLTKVRGRFSDFKGTIHVAEKPEDSWVEVTIQADSITTDNETRDNHLRSGDFLHVEHHPELTFRSTKVQVLDESHLRVSGDLTIRGTTKSLDLEVEYEGVTGRDLWGKSRVAFQANTEIDRDAFGASWNQVLETGGVLVGKKVQIDLAIQAVRTPGKTDVAA
jgi:polyisoprenoid-binding protein YceI